MKQELLEYIIRACAKEVLNQVNEAEEETKGAPAPPADGLGSADQPPVPKEEEPQETKPQEPETPKVPELKGVILVNPKDKSKLQRVKVKAGDDATLERTLHSLAAALAGPKVKVALSTMRMVKDAVKNPNSSAYVYIGKYDPQSDETFLLADKSLQVAKDSSIMPDDTGASVTNFKHPTDAELAQQMAMGGRTRVPEPMGEEIKTLIKTMVNEILDSK
jgi:hypothetical protein